MTLPTLAEIAEEVSNRARQCNSGTFAMPTDVAFYIADGILARLRPGWEAMEKKLKVYDEWNDSSDECFEIAHVALAADLRACAEALEQEGERSLDDPSDWCCCGHSGPFTDPNGGHTGYCLLARAALARPGVIEALK